MLDLLDTHGLPAQESGSLTAPTTPHHRGNPGTTVNQAVTCPTRSVDHPGWVTWIMAPTRWLLVVGCVLAPVALPARWASNLVTDQDTYLATVQPLITDPVIVSAVENRLTSAIDDQVSKLQLADKIGDELQSLGLPPKLATLATGYLATFRTDITDPISRMVHNVVTSEQIVDLWNAANAKTHTVFVRAMQGQYDDELNKLHSVNVDPVPGRRHGQTEARVGRSVLGQPDSRRAGGDQPHRSGRPARRRRLLRPAQHPGQLAPPRRAGCSVVHAAPVACAGRPASWPAWSAMPAGTCGCGWAPR